MKKDKSKIIHWIEKFAIGSAITLFALIVTALFAGYLSQFVRTERVANIESDVRVIEAHYTHIKTELGEIKTSIKELKNERNSIKAKRPASFSNYFKSIRSGRIQAVN